MASTQLIQWSVVRCVRPPVRCKAALHREMRHIFPRAVYTYVWCFMIGTVDAPPKLGKGTDADLGDSAKAAHFSVILRCHKVDREVILSLMIDLWIFCCMSAINTPLQPGN